MLYHSTYYFFKNICNCLIPDLRTIKSFEISFAVYYARIHFLIDQVYVDYSSHKQMDVDINIMKS